MAKWEEQQKPAQSQQKVQGAPGDGPAKEGDGIVDPNQLAHSRSDIAGAEPDTEEARAETAKRKGPRHVDLGGILAADQKREPKTVKCVVVTGGLMVRKANGGYENLPAGTTFDVEEGDLPGYLSAGTIALHQG